MGGRGAPRGKLGFAGRFLGGQVWYAAASYGLGLLPLVGEWVLEAKSPDGPPWPGGARATIESHDSGAHLVQRSTVGAPGAPDSVSIMGCDAANGTYFQLYSD